MFNNQEWDGSRPQKFRGGIQIVKPPYQTDFSPFGMKPNNDFKGLEQVKSKKHFSPKHSGYLPDWKPCLRILKSSYDSSKPVKITDLPCNTHLRPLRHVEKFSKNTRERTQKSRVLLSRSVKDLRTKEDRNIVKNLENWEKEILNGEKKQRELYSKYFNLRISSSSSFLKF